MKNKSNFEYKYVAPTAQERKEIESIRKNYLPSDKSMSKLDRLRELDYKVQNTPMLVSLIIGILGALIFGLGLSMILHWKIIVFGVLVAVVGCVPMGFAYPTFLNLTKKYKNKYSNEIIKLSDELLNGNEKQ